MASASMPAPGLPCPFERTPSTRLARIARIPIHPMAVKSKAVSIRKSKGCPSTATPTGGDREHRHGKTVLRPAFQPYHGRPSYRDLFGKIQNRSIEETNTSLDETDSQTGIDVPLNGRIYDNGCQVQDAPVERRDVFLYAHSSIFPIISSCLRAW